ncbi:MAG TPA: YfhO family protein [Verrucomicrobiae bacterium]|nr:YfhO family protein [Verrucomicrobiae bacterium]
MKKIKAGGNGGNGGKNPLDGWKALALVAVILSLLFWRSFLPGYVHFSNDGPLGMQVFTAAHVPEAFTGMWGDMNDIGAGAVWSLSSGTLLNMFFGPVAYAKFLAPFALFILGFGVFTFLRSLRLNWLASIMGTFAVILNTCFFAGACWGVASAEIAIGFDFLALGLFMGNDGEKSAILRMVRLALAGLCVGVNVMEAADIGVLCSVLVAGFMFFKSLLEAEGNFVIKAARGVGRVAVVSLFAAFIAVSTVIALLGTPGLVSNADETNKETPEAHWDWATQWSLPKMETLGIFVPGLFGYRMDTPKHMEPGLEQSYNGGVYWGGIGRSPEIDRFFDAGGENPPGGLMRFGYAGYYAGILTVLGAIWALVQSFRRQNPVYSRTQKILIWFWAFVMIASLLVAWGRFAPFFYGLLYKLPHFSAIRNPAKFIIFSSWAMAVLFAYGMDALSRRYLDATAKEGTRKWDGFDRNLIFAFVGLLVASVIGWCCYSAHKEALVHYIKKVGYGDDTFATMIATFSIGQAGWFVFIFAGAVVLLTLTVKGFFSGPRAMTGAVLLLAFMIFDLGRASLPFVIHWNYLQKYEVGMLNPVEKYLADKPYEHRVAKLLPPPLSTPAQFEAFDQLYGIEWTQHHFLYYGIQSLDVIQQPRLAGDLAAYEDALRMGFKQRPDGQWGLDESTFYKLPRRWELSNTRYLLGPAQFVDSFNAQFDPGRNRFHIIQRFAIGLKPGVTEFHQNLEELTAYPNDNGDYALIDFTGALPRAKLYSNWLVSTNDQANLKMLTDANFDPAQTVLVSTPQAGLPTVSTNQNSGTVDFTHYSSKHITFAADAVTPSVLLLNDHYDSHWVVTVDGKPAPLLRCNYIMRGVYLQPGKHTVQFDFSLPHGLLFVTLAAIVTGLLLTVWLVVATRKKSLVVS